MTEKKLRDLGYVKNGKDRNGNQRRYNQKNGKYYIENNAPKPSGKAKSNGQERLESDDEISIMLIAGMIGNIEKIIDLEKETKALKLENKKLKKASLDLVNENEELESTLEVADILNKANMDFLHENSIKILKLEDGVLFYRISLVFMFLLSLIIFIISYIFN